MLAVMIWFGTLLFIGGLSLAASGIRSIGRGLRDSTHPAAPVWLCRGLREVLLVICGAVIAVGYALDSQATMMVGAIILAEELYETGMVLFVLERGGLSASSTGRPCS